MSAITQGNLAASGYTILFVSANFEITPRPIEVTADAISKVYGEADPELTYQITSGNLVFGDLFSGSLSRAAGEGVGLYAITQGTLALSGNYELTYVGADLEITPKHITGGFTAGDKVYDSTTDAAVLTRTLDGVVGADDVSLTGGTASFVDKNVGVEKVVTLTGASLDGADKNNYILDSVDSSTADITARDLNVTAIGVDKVYDTTTDATVTFLDDRLAGDVLTFGYSASFDDANVGTDKPVNVTGITVGGADADNYNLVSDTALTTASITPKPITVTAESGQSKVFLSSDPVFTYTYSPNVPAVAFSGALSRDPGEAIGSYPIRLGTLTAGSNYSITFVPAQFTITGFKVFFPMLTR
jgi:hypothetical protein